MGWQQFDAARPKGNRRPAAAQPAGGGTATPVPLAPKSVAVIKAVQKANGLPVTGKLDARTSAFLNNYKPGTAPSAGGGGGVSASGSGAAATKAKASASAADAKATAFNQRQRAKEQARNQKITAKAAAKKAAAKVSVRAFESRGKMKAAQYHAARLSAALNAIQRSHQ